MSSALGSLCVNRSVPNLSGGIVHAFDLTGLIKEAFQLVSHYPECRNATLKFDESNPAVSLKVDKFACKQAIFELLLNSGHSNPNPAIQVGWCVRSTTILISIQDNGPGFRDEQIARLRGPCQYGTKNSLGLGIAVARNAVELQGGKLNLISGAGSLKSVCLLTCVQALQHTRRTVNPVALSFGQGVEDIVTALWT